jgi:hypothetical protein
VDDLGVELGAIVAARLVGDDGEGRAVAHRHDLEPGGELRDLVAVAHPHLMALADLPEAVEQRALLGDGEEGAAEFAIPLALVTRLDPAAELVGHDLLAVADAEDRQAAVEQRLRRARAAFLRHAGGRTGEDDALGSQPRERVLGLGEGGDFRIDSRLAHPAGDELGDLAAEIDNQDGIGKMLRVHAAR